MICMASLIIIEYNQLFKYLNDKELARITEILKTLIDSNFISIEDKSYILTVKSLILKEKKIK